MHGAATTKEGTFLNLLKIQPYSLQIATNSILFLLLVGYKPTNRACMMLVRASLYPNPASQTL